MKRSFQRGSALGQIHRTLPTTSDRLDEMHQQIDRTLPTTSDLDEMPQQIRVSRTTPSDCEEVIEFEQRPLDTDIFQPHSDLEDNPSIEVGGLPLEKYQEEVDIDIVSSTN